MAFLADDFTGRSFGKYEILCRLAVGGMAEIFLGFTRMGPFAYRPVVLKRILQEQREDESSLQALIDEAKVTATLSHPHVAQVLDLEKADEEVLLVIEFIRGATLDELVTLAADRKESVPLGFVLSVIRDAALGLHHAHSHKDLRGQAQPIIHRDVTPKNVMVDFDGIGKVLDFGIARAAGAARRTVAGMVRGTSAYMSPEQAIDGKMDIRTDIFSLGTIFHELLTGQRLFARGNPGKEMAAVYEAEIPVPSKINRRVPKALDTVVLKALERPLNRRYQSAMDLVRDLQLAAGATLWPAERCAELVRERFAKRRDEIAVLTKRIGEPEGAGVSTVPGKPAFEKKAPDFDESRTRIITNLSDGEASTARGQPPPPPSDVTGTQPGVLGAAPTLGSGKHEVTAFFTPDFSRVNSTDEAPAAASPGTGSISIQLDTDEHAARPTNPEHNRPTVEKAPPVTVPERAPVSRDSRTPMIVAALLALGVGTVGGGLIVNRMSPTQNTTPTESPKAETPGVGRLTISADRKIEVVFGANTLGITPLVDVYFPSGRHQFKVREPDATQWRLLEVDVKKDQVTKLTVALDTLPPLP